MKRHKLNLVHVLMAAWLVAAVGLQGFHAVLGGHGAGVAAAGDQVRMQSD